MPPVKLDAAFLSSVILRCALNARLERYGRGIKEQNQGSIEQPPAHNSRDVVQPEFGWRAAFCRIAIMRSITVSTLVSGENLIICCGSSTQ